MDPLSLQAPNLGLVRPAIALQSDAAAVLREGRVLAGEVLQTLGGGALVIGLGRHRVAAQSQVALEEGHRFLCVVEGEGSEVALRILPDETDGEPDLLHALRGVLGAARPLGEVLEALLQDLHGARSLSALADGLAGGSPRAAASAEQLAAALLGGGPLTYESKLALAAALSLPPAEATAIASELERWLAAALEPEPERAGALMNRLRAALAEELGAGRSTAFRERAFAAWLAAGERATGSASSARDLAGLLELAIERASTGEERAELLGRARALPLPQLGRALEALLLRGLLGLGAPPGELGAERARRLAAQAQGELKGRLLAALARLEPGLAREAVARALDGVEAEQLLNVARSRAGEALHWSVPTLDGERWSTAHLLAHPARREGERGASGERGTAWRLTLALDLSRTGLVQVDLHARPGALGVWVRAERPEAAAALCAGLSELESRLSTGGRAVAVQIACAPVECAAAGERSADVLFLREHRLMDLSA